MLQDGCPGRHKPPRRLARALIAAGTPTVSADEASTRRPLHSRQYIEEAWEPCRIRVDGDLMSCNFNANAELGGRATLCVIPTQALAVVEDPVRMKIKPNVMSEWLDRLTARGAGILLVHGKWFDNMWTSAAMAASGGRLLRTNRGAPRGCHRWSAVEGMGQTGPGRPHGKLAPRVRIPTLHGEESRCVRRCGASTGRALASHEGVPRHGGQPRRHAALPL